MTGVQSLMTDKCPNCPRGRLKPAPGEKIALGPYTKVCDYCGWSMTQTLDSRHDVRGRGAQPPR